MSDNICPLCGKQCIRNVNQNYYNYICDFCGEFFLYNPFEDFIDEEGRKYDLQKLKSYVYYHKKEVSYLGIKIIIF